MTLWGEPKRVHMQNVEQLNAHDCHQNVIEYSTTSSHQKKTLIYKTGAVSWASGSLAHPTQHKCMLRTDSAVRLLAEAA